MKKFAPIDINVTIARKEYDEFKSRILAKTDLKEREDILAFLKEKQYLSALIPSFLFIKWDLVALEKPIGGDFRTDLVVGNSEDNKFILIEFENAEENSLFKQDNKRGIRAFGTRFNDALSQITDWFWKIDESSDTDKRNFFEISSTDNLEYEGLIIIGRDCYMKGLDERRLRWRSNRTIINSQNFKVITYDVLIKKMGEVLATLESLAAFK
ncbi:Shedu anti-phage system protein SduA domain-containing protein [Bacillus cereus]|uniref:Shedu anti-phage system protein SduA domain-containing protein n=1 Tax=Bacillus cereus TaxID=1396 RepID=UPI000BF89A6A|nr:Shedu anti-phage system protein SduA domain-containing protein [Bacillus cereus]PFH89296.1 hypothetical protein COI78_24170 [Bacillus cereus]